MSEKTFKTSAVLAAMHSFPAIIAVTKGKKIRQGSIIEALGELRELAPEIAGLDYSSDHMSWCELAKAMRPVLSRHFTALASEPIPDEEFWSRPTHLDPGKMENLRQWTLAMDRKYGAMIEVPDISAEVMQNLEPLLIDSDKILHVSLS